MEAHPVRIDDLHLADFLLQDVEFVALEAKNDVLGGEGIAIVKFQPLTQFKSLCQLVRVTVQDSARRGPWVCQVWVSEGVMQSKAEPERRTAQ